MTRFDECGMASVMALAAVLLMLSGTATLFILSGHNRLAAKEAVQTMRLLEASRSAVRMEAARLEAAAQARRQLGSKEVQGVSGTVQGDGVCYRAAAVRLSEAGAKKAEYRLTAMSWQTAAEEADPMNTAAVGGKCSYVAALYRLEGERMVFVRWEK